ncbi:MAG: hypothetical protein QM796_08790 [Chthoniobacteraceae bacterium]
MQKRFIFPALAIFLTGCAGTIPDEPLPASNPASPAAAEASTPVYHSHLSAPTVVSTPTPAPAAMPGMNM